MEAWTRTGSTGMDRVDGYESFWWSVNRTYHGPTGFQN